MTQRCTLHRNTVCVWDYRWGRNYLIVHPKAQPNLTIYLSNYCFAAFGAGCYIRDVELCIAGMAWQRCRRLLLTSSATGKAIRGFIYKPHGAEHYNIHTCGRSSCWGWSERLNDGHSHHKWPAAALRCFVLSMAIVITQPVRWLNFELKGSICAAGVDLLDGCFRLKIKVIWRALLWFESLSIIDRHGYDLWKHGRMKRYTKNPIDK